MFSRRDTLKISLTLSAMGLSAAPAFAWKTGEPEEKISCDILVIGSGIAGTVAALQAVEDGATVLMTIRPLKTNEAAIQEFAWVHF